jgi:hypothetical protein
MKIAIQAHSWNLFVCKSPRRSVFFLTCSSRVRISAAPGVFFSFFFYIQMFYYTIMKSLLSLLENVNKSRTSAGSLSLIFNILATHHLFPHMHISYLPLHVCYFVFQYKHIFNILTNHTRHLIDSSNLHCVVFLSCNTYTPVSNSQNT